MPKGMPAEETTEVLNKAIRRLQDQMESGELKGSMSDLVRLLQLRNEITGSQLRPVTARWVDECQKRPATEE